ncbi:MAG: hypothetical protein GQ557_02245 [Mycoplasmataceae bacterium]|nr:hypothetical protein [Mycoplasmataceae bacterium]
MFDDEGEADKNSYTHHNKTYNSLEWIEHWANDNMLDTKIVQGEEWAFAGGDSTIKLDSNGEDLAPTIFRKDTYFFDTDFKGEISAWSGLIYTYSKMTNQSGQTPEPQYYYLLEDRKYSDSGKPQYRLSIKKGSGNIANAKTVDMNPETIPFSRLSRDISHKFKKDYPNTKLGEWNDLPLIDLGIYIIKASESVSFLPAVSGGESLLSNMIHSLMSYDFYWSSMLSNMYVAKDKLIVPQHMQSPTQNLSNAYGGNYFNGWDSFIQTKVDYTNPEDNKPILFQPSLRADDWIKTRNNILQTIAMDIGVDERTISSAIVPQAEKPTAREISSDEHTTTLFVEAKQKLLKNTLDKMLYCVLNFYGFTEETVTVKFSKAGLTNQNNLATILSVLKQNDMIDDFTAIEMFFNDKNHKQHQVIYDRMVKERKEKQMIERENNQQDVDEKIEQMNNQDISHVKKEKKGLFGRNRKEDK